jgi:hypothetical protein
MIKRAFGYEWNIQQPRILIDEFDSGRVNSIYYRIMVRLLSVKERWRWPK